jgi:hypothetical protein
MEDQVMQEKFEGFRRNLGDLDDGVYMSSSDLFLFYKQTFTNCAKLSTGKPFLDLCKMYQKWLDKYKDLLLSKLPRYALLLLLRTLVLTFFSTIGMSARFLLMMN